MPLLPAAWCRGCRAAGLTDVSTADLAERLCAEGAQPPDSSIAPPQPAAWGSREAASSSRASRQDASTGQISRVVRLMAIPFSP